MIHYVEGDATQPQVVRGTRQHVLAHLCNDRGGWGKGFVLAVSARWPEPEEAYRAWHRYADRDPEHPFELGQIQLVEVEADLHVANLIAQHGYKPRARSLQPPIRYDALRTCLETLAHEIADRWGRATVHMPRIGTGLAGGHWDKILPIIREELAGYDVYVYDLPTERRRWP